METLIMHPKTKKQLAALKAIAKALNVPFQKEKTELSEREKAVNLYGKNMVEDIERAEISIKKGHFKILDPTKSLWENIR